MYYFFRYSDFICINTWITAAPEFLHIIIH